MIMIKLQNNSKDLDLPSHARSRSQGLPTWGTSHKCNLCLHMLMSNKIHDSNQKLGFLCRRSPTAGEQSTL
jgi:hypothetical protein